MKKLLTVTSLIEFGTGLVLLALPSLLIGLLFGSTPVTLLAPTVARLAGIAIIALAVACWLARNDGQSSAAKGLVIGLLFYNTAVAIVLVYSSLGLTLSGSALWPVVLIHLAMSVWCIISLINKSDSDK